MSFAPGYTPTTSFVNDETNAVAGRSTVRTVAVDTELANISSSITELKANAQKLQRDDDKLKDLLVEPYALAEQTRALIASKGTPRGLWASGTVYAVGDVVQQSNFAYICYTAHVAASPFTAAGFWLGISGDGSAAASASAAATSATNAATSATNAASGATTATTQATNASTSATNASNSATASANSATASSNSASAAANSEAAAAASYDSFDDRYLGAKAVAPTLDNDGNALITGALYFDSVIGGGTMRVWSGSAWANLPATTAEAISNTPAGNIAATTVQGAINEIVSDLAASSGASLVGYLPNGTGAVVTTVQAKQREDVSIGDFGTVALTALNNAGAALAAGGVLRLPKASYSLAATFTFAGQRLHLAGDGANVSNIVFDPAVADVAIEYNNPAAGGLYQGSIKNIGFSSSNSIAKTAISLANVADTVIEGIGIPGGVWSGDSIGIRTYGRQTLQVRHCQINCARPIVFSQNPVFTSLNTDHYVVEYGELSSNSATRAVIEFEDGVMHTNTTLRNLALTGGKTAILWNDTTSVGASYAMCLENIRCEQGLDATGWTVDLQTVSQSLQNISIRNVFTDAGRNGIRLRKAQLITLENVYFPQTSGTQLDITLIAGSRLILTNCFFQTGGTKTITNGRCIRRTDAITGHTVEEWIFDASAAAGAEVTDTYHHGVPVSLVNTATILLGAAGSTTGFVFISSSEDVSAIFTLMGATAQTREISDPDGFFSITKGTASSYNIYHEAGNYFLQNNRGVTATVSVFKMLTQA